MLTVNFAQTNPPLKNTIIIYENDGFEGINYIRNNYYTNE